MNARRFAALFRFTGYSYPAFRRGVAS